MDQLITHACGHGQIHHLAGFASQQERKARWLRTTQCRACFAAARRSEQTAVAADHVAAIAHLDLPALIGSERQVAWATTIRARRLVQFGEGGLAAARTGQSACLGVTDAKWWIEHRDVPDPDLLAPAAGIPQAGHAVPIRPGVRS